jgi:hypothetical protein
MRQLRPVVHAKDGNVGGINRPVPRIWLWALAALDTSDRRRVSDRERWIDTAPPPVLWLRSGNPHPGGQPLAKFRARGHNPDATRRRAAPSVVSFVTWTRVSVDALRV